MTIEEKLAKLASAAADTNSHNALVITHPNAPEGIAIILPTTPDALTVTTQMLCTGGAAIGIFTMAPRINLQEGVPGRVRLGFQPFADAGFQSSPKFMDALQKRFTAELNAAGAFGPEPGFAV